MGIFNRDNWSIIEKYNRARIHKFMTKRKFALNGFVENNFYPSILEPLFKTIYMILKSLGRKGMLVLGWVGMSVSTVCRKGSRILTWGRLKSQWVKKRWLIKNS